MKARVASVLLWAAIVLSISIGGECVAGDEKHEDGDKMTKVESIYDLTVKDIDGDDVALSKYKGGVLLIVNVASK